MTALPKQPPRSVFELKTTRLRLRPVRVDDVGLLFELDNDPEVMRYINGGIPVSIETIERDFLPTFLHEDDVSGFSTVELIDSGDRLGWCCLRASEQRGEASIGYRFLRQAWGHGYATESARALLAYGFDELGLDRVTATTYEDNHPSIRVLERLGFQLARRFRADLSLQETAHFDSTDPWPGWDLSFELRSATWQDQKAEGET